MPKPPFFQQTYPFSCVPACLKMVLSSLGLEKSETEIRSFCECDADGTEPSKAVEAVTNFGFEASLGLRNTFDDLTELVSQDITPIIFIKAVEQSKYSHAVVVYKIIGEKVYILDPELGERKLSINQLNETWSRGLTIVIEKKIDSN